MIKKIHLICAARPNFMKIAPLYHALKGEKWCNVEIIHTGQHYDYQMSQAFFDDFELPKPHHHLNVGSGSHGEQTSQTMIAYEELCNKNSPDLVIVVGDVNATMACTITAKKLHLKVAHLEAGLRSFDMTMPEEINRVITDSICDYYWTPSKDADVNLINEGVNKDKISLVGNIMIDTYCMMKEKINQSDILEKNNLSAKKYSMLTLHRPSNVDSIKDIKYILDKIESIKTDFVFPVHPRTKKILNNIDFMSKNIKLLEPQNYINFMSLVSNSAYVITDSGGIQEETTYLNIPCFTLRENTERPITIDIGTNQLVSSSNLLEKIKNLKSGSIPSLWDGNTASRIKEKIYRDLCK